MTTSNVDLANSQFLGQCFSVLPNQYKRLSSRMNRQLCDTRFQNSMVYASHTSRLGIIPLYVQKLIHQGKLAVTDENIFHEIAKFLNEDSDHQGSVVMKGHVSINEA